MKHVCCLLVGIALLAGCGPVPAVTTALESDPVPTATPTAEATPTLTPVPTATPTASPSPTPDPYDEYTVAGLSIREYGGGELQAQETLAVSDAFTRTLITYPSDGLTIYGFVNVPLGEGPFPVVIAIHGYVDPEIYATLDYTTRYADGLARAGFLVIHPNLRNFPPSDEQDGLFRVGAAVDVLNLIAIVRQTGGQPGLLREADPSLIGLWGHSMGGGISLRAITVDQGVGAAVLYGSMSGDERLNYEKILEWSGGERGEEELSTSDEVLQRISPIFHLDRIRAAVGIHHGELDETVPLQWSIDLCDQLQGLEKIVECFTYPGQSHTFQGEGDQLFVQRVAAFFEQYLRAR